MRCRGCDMLSLLVATTLLLPPNAPPDCAQGQVMTFNGTVYSCTSALSSPCANTATLRTLKNGTVACLTDDPAPPSITTCPAGEVVTALSPKGHVACARLHPKLTCRASDACTVNEFPLNGQKACCHFEGSVKTP